MQFLTDYGLFLAKSVTFVIAALILIASAVALVRSGRSTPGARQKLKISNLGDRLREMADTLNDELLDADQVKKRDKARKAELKAQRKARQRDLAGRPRLFVLSFDGDLQAHAVASLREEINAVLQVATGNDEILLRLESGGGLVHAYGLAASQLTRIRARGLRLTVAVDKVAASGGYLMACVANRVIAAPFAIIGSIGVVAQIPNFNRLLKKHDVELELHTAGEFKRTLTMFGENTDAARTKFRQDLDQTHELFKTFVAEHRPGLDMATVATGEHWFGTRALQLRLIDEICSSDDYLLRRVQEVDVFEVSYLARKPLAERLGLGLARIASAFGRTALEPAQS